MDFRKWMILGLLSFGVVAFGYIVFSGSRRHTPKISRGLVAVSSVRGTQGGAGEAISSSVPETMVEYTKSLQNDADLAEKNARKYSDVNKERAEDIKRVQAEAE